MTQRITITLAVCIVGGLAAVAALFLPGNDTATAAHGADHGGAQPAAVAPAAEESTEPSAALQSGPSTVTIASFAFDGPAVVKPGEEITVVNLDGAPHTMTANDGSFDTGLIDGGGQVTLTMPTTPGTYEFFCAVHPGMVSTITVQA